MQAFFLVCVKQIICVIYIQVVLFNENSYSFFTTLEVECMFKIRLKTISEYMYYRLSSHYIMCFLKKYVLQFACFFCRNRCKAFGVKIFFTANQVTSYKFKCYSFPTKKIKIFC